MANFIAAEAGMLDWEISLIEDIKKIRRERVALKIERLQLEQIRLQEIAKLREPSDSVLNQPDQSTSQHVDQPTNQPKNQPQAEPTNQQSGQPLMQPTYQPTVQVETAPVDEAKPSTSAQNMDTEAAIDPSHCDFEDLDLRPSTAVLAAKFADFVEEDETDDDEEIDVAMDLFIEARKYKQ